jgi:hypothetical protein
MTDDEQKAWEELVARGIKDIGVQVHGEYMDRVILAADAELTALRARIEVLEKALLFYSNEDNWENDVVDIGVGNMAIPHSSEAARDEGKVARAALKEGK